jgi:hypothetical protein
MRPAFVRNVIAQPLRFPMTVDPPLGILAVASVADRPKWVTIRGSTVRREICPSAASASMGRSSWSKVGFMK